MKISENPSKIHWKLGKTHEENECGNTMKVVKYLEQVEVSCQFSLKPSLGSEQDIYDRN